ncbi:dipeptide ABC transporter ATP-binding protein [Nocardia macrotermitis]|uniref:Vitamin B12 import ATP-binding protein BtuD n=1 Tax=Nocardia macrotermitis TaxID=2585198 RepID=A0A7K0D0Y6_9NOCA|nr:ABC transporter ATP-binding protein [Nocardia macrotermitis]MQY19383.1 Vitamin B12 import ATP-binding protein BtuD [Nocardia macrotermitis]
MTETTERTAALSISSLSVTFATDAGTVDAVRDVSYEVFPGEVLAIVGESGSGKSVSSRTAIGLLPHTARVRGTVTVGTHTITTMSDKQLTAIRGGDISMVFQEPGAALDPLFTVGFQLAEAIRAHTNTGRKAAKARAIELLRTVGLPDPEHRVDFYPHQLSGGQKQRVMIAIAIACEPKVIIADEPTTALDVTVQAEILELLRDLRDRIGSAIVLITHNMGVVADLADRVVVMRSGKVVETAPVEQLFAAPQEQYTRDLLAAVPHLGAGLEPTAEPVSPIAPQADSTVPATESKRLESESAPDPGESTGEPAVGESASAEAVRGESASGAEPIVSADEPAVGASASSVEAVGGESASGSEPIVSADEPAVEASDRPESESSTSGSDPVERRGDLNAGEAAAEPVLEVRDLVVEFPGALGRTAFRAVDTVSFSIARGETLGLVGESGSGKTTIGRCVAALQRPSAGVIRVQGQELTGLSERKLRPVRRRLGFVFQDPATSLNPRLTVGQCIAEPLVVHCAAKGAELRSRVRAILDAVQLPEGAESRYPHELSGGQRQRASLARALVLNPDLLVADEPTSALDVSVQARVLELFAELQREFGWACLFVSHDLAVVDQLAARIMVLRNGSVVEEGTRDEILRHPSQEYTQRLVAAVPVPDPVEQRRRRLASAALFAADGTG